MRHGKYSILLDRRRVRCADHSTEKLTSSANFIFDIKLADFFLYVHIENGKIYERKKEVSNDEIH